MTLGDPGSLRLFRDKLVGERDQARFNSALSNVLRTEWGGTEVSSRSTVYWVTSGMVGSATMPAFGRGLMRLGQEDWATTVQRGRAVWEREAWALALYCTQESLELAARYDRQLSQPGGSLLLVGWAGVGRSAAV